MGNARVGSSQVLLEDSELIIGSLHLHGDWRVGYLPKRYREAFAHYETSPGFIKDREDYFRITLNAIAELGKLRERLGGDAQSRPFIYGHHWGAAWLANKRRFEVKFNHDMIIKESDSFYSDVLDYNWSAQAPIQFFTDEQLVEISDAHIKAKVYPEINARYIKREASEHNKYRCGMTLLDAYAQQCSKHSVIPYMSVCSDAHNTAELQNIDWADFCKRNPSLAKVQVWAEELR